MIDPIGKDIILSCYIALTASTSSNMTLNTCVLSFVFLDFMHHGENGPDLLLCLQCSILLMVSL